jgi:hypothetical protein
MLLTPRESRYIVAVNQTRGGPFLVNAIARELRRVTSSSGFFWLLCYISVSGRR